jgi:hypothetical protein
MLKRNKFARCALLCGAIGWALLVGTIMDANGRELSDDLNGLRRWDLAVQNLDSLGDVNSRHLDAHLGDMNDGRIKPVLIMNIGHYVAKISALSDTLNFAEIETASGGTRGFWADELGRIGYVFVPGAQQDPWLSVIFVAGSTPKQKSQIFSCGIAAVYEVKKEIDLLRRKWSSASQHDGPICNGNECSFGKFIGSEGVRESFVGVVQNASLQSSEDCQCESEKSHRLGDIAEPAQTFRFIWFVAAAIFYVFAAHYSGRPVALIFWLGIYCSLIAGFAAV